MMELSVMCAKGDISKTQAACANKADSSPPNGVNLLMTTSKFGALQPVEAFLQSATEMV